MKVSTDIEAYISSSSSTLSNASQTIAVVTVVIVVQLKAIPFWSSLHKQVPERVSSGAHQAGRLPEVEGGGVGTREICSVFFMIFRACRVVRDPGASHIKQEAVGECLLPVFPGSARWCGCSKLISCRPRLG